MSTSLVDSKRGSEVDEKNADEISNGLALTVAEDTVEATHQCTLSLSPSVASQKITDFTFLKRYRRGFQKNSI